MATCKRKTIIFTNVTKTANYGKFANQKNNNIQLLYKLIPQSQHSNRRTKALMAYKLSIQFSTKHHLNALFFVHRLLCYLHAGRKNTFTIAN